MLARLAGPKNSITTATSRSDDQNKIREQEKSNDDNKD
jgi:hypothetical protein